MKILIAGDYCPCYRLADKIDSGEYESVMGDSRRWTAKADYSIVNLECPISDIGDVKIKKRGPNLTCSPRGVEALRWAGFNCVTLANNHFYDYGDKGVNRTLQLCKDYSLDVVGGGVNQTEASRILYKTINNESLAIINCCEHEFSIAMDGQGGSNPLNPIRQYYSIKEAKHNAKYVIVIIHGGHEHYQLPSTRMQETYRFFIDAGADVVVNHHQHCYSGYECYNSKPIFYGLGNFCFDEEPIQIGQLYNFGYAILLHIKGEKVEFELIPYEQCGDRVGVFEIESDAFNKIVEKLNTIIADPIKLQEEEKRYYESTFSNIGSVINSNKSRLLRAFNRFLFPSKQLSTEYILRLYNLLLCESHRDRVFSFLVSKFNEIQK